MKKLLLSLLCLFAISSTAISQSFSAKILDETNNEPIPFAAIQTGKNKGVISNEEGVFNIDLLSGSIKEVVISCLGYETITITIDDIKTNNLIVTMKPATNQLGTVYLSNTKPNIDSIIAKANRNFATNYKQTNVTHKFFIRETSYADFKKLDFDLKRASHVKRKQLVGVNNELDNMEQAFMNSNMVHFFDYLGSLSIKDQKNQKITIDKATQIINSQKNFSLEKMQEQAQNIVLKYLDTSLTYKLKSGLFKIEDSLSLKEMRENSKNQKDEFDSKNLRSETYGFLNSSINSLTKELINPDYYNHELKDVFFDGESMIYAITYKPRRSKAKYAGTLFITDDSYAVVKADYRYSKGKRGQKLNLRLILGVKFIENVSTGTVIFKKNENNWYAPRYIKEEEGRYFYVNRPIKFIENSRNRNKVLFNFKIEGDMKSKQEYLITNSEEITESDYASIKEIKKIPFSRQRRYNATIWSGTETIAPTKELQKFDASDN